MRTVKKVYLFPILRLRFIFVFLCIILTEVQAQNHFWEQQYGANATLTGGAGISGLRDNTVLFYNPGEMGFIDIPRISLSANLYGVEIVDLKNIAGTNLNAESVRAQFFPQFVGGSFEVKKFPRLKIFYGVLVRNRASVRYNVDYTMNYDVIKGAIGNELYRAKLGYDQAGTETWAGIGIGYRITDYLSCGLSIFGSYLNVESSTNVAINADALFIDSTNHIVPYTATSNEAATVRMDNINLIFKLGLALDLKHWKVGVTATLPSAHLWGTGSMSKLIEGYNLNIYSPDTTNVFAHPSFLATDEQRKLDVNYKTVPSFGLGITYQHRLVKIDLVAEYFLGADYYDLMRGKDGAYIQPAAAYGGQPIQDFLLVRTHSTAICNVGIGATVKVTPKVKLLTGFRTDFNNKMNFLPYITGLGLNSLSTSYWHLMHFSLGTSYFKGANDFTIGVSYAFGLAADRTQVINFTSPVQDLWLRGKPANTVRTYVNAINIVIGYTYFFRGRAHSSAAAEDQLKNW